tara:strand:+ start:229 stop:588 length:360 start_codon:yes stop_codon:yes gene_type:complete
MNLIPMGISEISRVNKREEIKSKFSFSFQETNDIIDVMQTNYLINLSRKYLIPLPEGNENWTPSNYSSRRNLSKSAQVVLRNQIRAEERERFDRWARWVTLLIGLIGALIGLVSVLEKI